MIGDVGVVGTTSTLYVDVEPPVATEGNTGAALMLHSHVSWARTAFSAKLALHHQMPNLHSAVHCRQHRSRVPNH